MTIPQEGGDYEVNKLFVGNLNFRVTSQDLETLFGQYGQVSEAAVVNDKMTGRSRGFGFVTFNTAEEAKKAADALNGKDFQGRNLAVNEARPKA